MKVLIVGDPHGNISKIKKSDLNKAELILITGDLGKADLARKQAFDRIKRAREGLPELERTAKEQKAIHEEVHSSTINVLKELSKYAPVYTLEGNVGIFTKSQVREDYEEFGIKLLCTRDKVDAMKNVHLVKNVVRNLGKLKVGFLEYYIDNSWVKEFQEKDKGKIREAKKDTAKAKKVLERFGKSKIDILVCHQPPFGVLDRVNFPGVPPHWKNKRAGGKAILDYVRKYQPKYVFCGHMHENRGNKKVGKTMVYNVGSLGESVLMDFE
jgi:Icc-related predicted phosphoesterase